MDRSKSVPRKYDELDLKVTSHYQKVYQEKSNLSYAIVSAFNFMFLNAHATTQRAINQDLEHYAEFLTQTVTEQKHRNDRTLLSVISLTRIYRRIAQKVNPHNSIEGIIKEIATNGTKLADHILMQSQIIRKFAQPHFREGMVSPLTHNLTCLFRK